MEKIVSYLTQNAASALGVAILTGLTVSSSAVGASKIVESVRVKEPKAAIVKNHVVSLPSQASDRAKTVILTKFGSPTPGEITKKSARVIVSPKLTVKTAISPILKATGASIATTTTTTPTQNANQCVVTLFGLKYDVAPLRNSHSGGDIFTCGTDMTAIYQSQHGTNVSRMAKYLITVTNPNPSVSPLPSTTPSQVNHDYDDDEEKFEDEKKDSGRKYETEKNKSEKEHELDDDFEHED